MADKNDISSALYKAADRRTRQYGVRAGLLLALALFAAVGSALLLTRYMETRTAEARVPTSAVVVADKDLAVGTELRGDQLRVVAWPIASLPEGALTNPKDLEGKVVAVRLYKGEPILPPKLSGGDAGSLSALLPVGMRAAAVRVDDVVGVAGFIHPGDIVDVIATVRQEGSNSQTSSKIILQAIKVLAVGKELDHRSKGTDKVVPATVATLMVDAEESERLALAAAQGRILLTLRSNSDTSLVATKGVTPNSLLAAASDAPPGPPPKQMPRVSPTRRHAVAKAPVVEPPPKPSEVVEIMRGNVFERRDFQKEARR